MSLLPLKMKKKCSPPTFKVLKYHRSNRALLQCTHNQPCANLSLEQVSIVTEFANFVRGVRVVYHITDHARVTLGQHLTQQVPPTPNPLPSTKCVLTT